MRSLVLLALVTLAAFPLSAHDHGYGPRRVVVVEAPRCAPRHAWEEHRWDHRYDHRHGYYEHDDYRYDHHVWPHHDCDGDRVVFRALPMPRPLTPPFAAQVELRLR
jgi:hypothetical protein